MKIIIDQIKKNKDQKWYGKTRVMSYEFKSTSWNYEDASSNLRVTASNPRVATSKPRDTSSNPRTPELLNQWKLK